ncbi:MAG: hypothetical protein ACRCVT_10150 [Leadbetterella sp.]
MATKAQLENRIELLEEELEEVKSDMDTLIETIVENFSINKSIEDERKARLFLQNFNSINIESLI